MDRIQTHIGPPVLATKLVRPHVSDDLLIRPRLLDLLSLGLDCKLIFVSAQAGAGKTSLVAEWLSRFGCPDKEQAGRQGNGRAFSERFRTTWLSLDEYDSDLATFLGYFGAAVETLFPNALPMTRSLLNEPQLPPIEYLANTLINEILAISEKFILVLDDYHNINNKVVHRFMSRFIVNVPDPMILVIVSRRDPPFPFARLRSQQRLVEVRTGDLHFTRDEAREFFKRTVADALPAETVDSVIERMEGWATGLRMVAISLSHHGDDVDLLSALQTSERQVMNFLVDEVLEQLSEETQRFLLRVAVLERFSAPLCDALRGDGEHLEFSQEILDKLERDNLTTGLLDDEPGWYRFCQLFRELLLFRLHSRFGDGGTMALHARASAWFKENGYVQDAIEHAIAASEFGLAAEFVEQGRNTLMNREEWQTLEKWLGMLPVGVVQQHPALLLARAWTHHRHLNVAAARSVLEKVERLMDGETEALEEQSELQLRGEMEALWSEQWFWKNDCRRSMVCARQAMSLLSEESKYARGVSLIYLARGLRMTGEGAQALRVLNQALEYGDEQSGSLLVALLGIHLMNGELDELTRLAEHVIRSGEKRRWTSTIYWVHLGFGIACYEQNKLDDAVRHFEKVVNERQDASLSALHNGFIGLALACQALGHLEEADLAFEELQDLAMETRNTLHQLEVKHFRARLSLLRGDLGAASHILQCDEMGQLFAAPFFLEVPPVTRARVLIARGTASGKLEAVEIAQGLLKSAETTHNTRRIIELLALLAVAEDALCRRQVALDYLRRAIVMAAPGRLVRTFVDYGRPVAGLLHTLASEGQNLEYVRALLSVFPRERATTGQLSVLRLPGQEVQIEPLTERESEVLALLGERLSNKEIAVELTVSPLTVRKHASNIYHKLHVNSRRQAVTVARQLGILPTG
jgi:LuxR family maltose regulon positive regulatory protein